MDPLPGEAPARPSLRERKKARTRALIQAEALRLFRTRGYDETSIEEIAEAAEVSPSTVFRYYPTKPDLVIYDDLDERMIEAFRSQPAGMNAVQTMRSVFSSAFGLLAADAIELQRERAELIVAVPELRAAMLGELVRTLREVADLIAERSGRASSDDEVLALSGAIIGVAIAAWFASDGDEWMERFLVRVDTGLKQLESGFKL